MANNLFNPGDVSWINKGSESNFKGFVKNNKTLFNGLNAFVFVSTIILTIWLSKPIQNLLQEHVFNWFSTFQNDAYFSKLFIESGFNSLIGGTWKVDTESFRSESQGHGYYQIAVFAAFIIFTIDTLFLIIEFVKQRKEWSKFSLSLGVFISPELKSFSQKLNRNQLSLLFFIFKIILVAWDILPQIAAQFKNYKNFENSFFFFLFIYALLTWFLVGVWIFAKYTSWYLTYHKNFSKYEPNVFKAQKLPLDLFALIFANFLFFALSYYSIFLKLPWDFFFIWLILQHFPWSKIKTQKPAYIKDPLMY